MPEPPRMVPLYIARIADLRVGQTVSITCRRCRHAADLAAVHLREWLPRDVFVKQIGPRFRCRKCGHKGAEVDARRALGYYG
jgi:DNA-directed RNA polymerase subunit RPC12/RpoP